MPNFALEWIMRRYSPKRDYEFSLESLRWICIGAEPINVDTLKTFEEIFREYGLQQGAVCPCYGLAEGTVGVSITRPLGGYKVNTRHGYAAPTVGRILPNVDVKIASEDNDTGYGHILIKGDSVATHALINGRKQKIVDESGYYDTRDIGYFENNNLVISGRSDDMFIVNGENYFPYEVENMVRSTGYAFRNRAVCFDIPAGASAASSREIVILYESKKMPEDEKNRIHSKIEQQVRSNTGLPIAKIVDVPPKSIPVTPSGKLRRRNARKRYLEGRFKCDSETMQ